MGSKANPPFSVVEDVVVFSSSIHEDAEGYEWSVKLCEMREQPRLCYQL